VLQLILVNYQILDELNPPTKVIGKFLKTWRLREEARAEYSHTATTPLTLDGGDVAGVALTLSKRLIAVVKVKDVLHIEAGLDMIALVMAISTEVRNIDSFQGLLKNFSLLE